MDWVVNVVVSVTTCGALDDLFLTLDLAPPLPLPLLPGEPMKKCFLPAGRCEILNFEQKEKKR